MSVNVQIQKGIHKALKTIIYQESKKKPNEPMTKTSILIEALSQWLDNHEGKKTGGEKRPKGRGKESLQAKVSDELEARLNKECKRRDAHDIKPRRKRTIVEAALIEWMLKKSYDPGVEPKAGDGDDGD
jgi:hypothetical protein